MSSIRSINAFRANGALSRGPSTSEGKTRSAANAIRHGLLARTVVLDVESKDAFLDLLNSFVARFQPADSVEMSLVEEMVAATWRQRRCWALETSMADEAGARFQGASPASNLVAAYSDLASGPTLALIHRYEARINGMYQRALKNLLLLRQTELPNEPNPISEHSPAPDLDSSLIPEPEPDLAPVLEAQPTPPPPSHPAASASTDVSHCLGDFASLDLSNPHGVSTYPHRPRAFRP